MLLLVDNALTTPVIRQLRARSYAQILGHIAVRYSRQSDSNSLDTDTDVVGWIEILHVLQRVEIDAMRRRSFPLNLLPTTPLQTIQPAEQLIIWPTSSSTNDDTTRAA